MWEHPGKGTKEEVTWPQGTGRGAPRSPGVAGLCLSRGVGAWGRARRRSVAEVREDTPPPPLPRTELLRSFPTDLLLLQVTLPGDFPGGPAVNSLCCHRGGFDPWSGN